MDTMASPQPGMVLLLMIVQAEDASDLGEALTNSGNQVTRINAAGGFLRTENVVLMVGVLETDVPQVLALVQQECRRRTQLVFPLLGGDPGVGSYPPVEVEVGGAVIFVLDVEQVTYLAGRAQKTVTAS
jgi:uncharacterized protein YaaQ